VSTLEGGYDLDALGQSAAAHVPRADGPLTLVAVEPRRAGPAARPAVGRRPGGGHAHIVDDADVETPGVCHLEVWTTNFMSGDGYANAAPACTLKSLPFVELGAGYAHYWGQTLSAPVFGPQIKVRFTDPSSDLVLGLGMNGGVNLNTGNFETGSLLAWRPCRSTRA
jgi:hypothetical protein